MRRWWMLVFGFVLVLAALSACSRQPTASTEINVVLTDYKFEPDTLIIPPGKEITLHLTNKGAIEHELVIMKYGTTVGDSFGDEDEENIYWEIEVKPGESTTVTFTSPDMAGQYQFVCGIEGHFTAGMHGTMTVLETVAQR
ncbi:cupredoxin domain-containing protein [Chloroflexus aggregans]|uniref:Blue (Type 1) copper domain protein n=1 Tax=Chloroflexus aggregans (strain MD-66 / DSM 9485) TaxID=326427 RepID=B8G4M7_CHLAD|nr:cupredoxin domain-containing protein [Chloroflexus aggregans]ACL25503.1 blue (type 1) copper domain protein [Chloroflexus aggregans DSM 9485]